MVSSPLGRRDSRGPAPPAGPARAPPPTRVPQEVDSILGQGDPVRAVLFAYSTAEADVCRAFGLKLPKQWTHREFLREHLRRDMGYVAIGLPQLYALFEPVRYGGSKDVPAASLRELVRSLYEEPALRSLPVAPPSTGSGGAGGKVERREHAAEIGPAQTPAGRR